jgi:hypothetical protein
MSIKFQIVTRNSVYVVEFAGGAIIDAVKVWDKKSQTPRNEPVRGPKGEKVSLILFSNNGAVVFQFPGNWVITTSAVESVVRLY